MMDRPVFFLSEHIRVGSDDDQFRQRVSDRSDRLRYLPYPDVLQTGVFIRGVDSCVCMALDESRFAFA